MLTDAPGKDVVEVSIFGPGKGESIAVHLGSNQWILIDSCIDQASKSIPVLDYLRRIGANPGSDVRLVVGTHAHDDHIAGLSRVFEECTSADFVCSQALTGEEFFAALEVDANMEALLRQSIRSEYRRMWDLVRDRSNSTGMKPMKRALQDRPLLRLELNDSVGSVHVTALSPSDEAVTRSLVALGRDLVEGSRFRLGAADPNELAVALWVQAGGKTILLGADLLKGPSGCGWQAVLATFMPTVPAGVFKIPHHGAPNAHHPDVWTELLQSQPIALLAPYRAGVTPRPNPDDIDRITSLTANAYVTASPDKLARSRAVQRTAAQMQDLARNVRDPWGKSGHVRARAHVSENTWRVETVSPARRLS